MRTGRREREGQEKSPWKTTTVKQQQQHLQVIQALIIIQLHFPGHQN